jgi:hypothetical protein
MTYPGIEPISKRIPAQEFMRLYRGIFCGLIESLLPFMKNPQNLEADI